MFVFQSNYRDMNTASSIVEFIKSGNHRDMNSSASIVESIKVGPSALSLCRAYMSHDQTRNTPYQIVHMHLYENVLRFKSPTAKQYAFIRSSKGGYTQYFSQINMQGIRIHFTPV